MSIWKMMTPNGELQEIHNMRLAASRHFHAEATELLLSIAPSSVSFTCIGVENARTYSYLRSTGKRDTNTPLPPRWTSRLTDFLPLERQRVPKYRPCVLHPSELGSLFEPSDPEGRVLLVLLESRDVIHGVAGLERSCTEPEFSSWELHKIGALAGALSLAATYALTVERLAYEEAVSRAGSGRSSLLILADHDARQIIWASSTEKQLDWTQDVLPLQRQLFEGDAEGALSAGTARCPLSVSTAMMATEIHELGLSTCRYSVVRVPTGVEVPLSKREREVAQLLVGGYANLNIAAHLGISENTVRTYVRRLYKKLKVCNRIDLIRAYDAAS